MAPSSFQVLCILTIGLTDPEPGHATPFFADCSQHRVATAGFDISHVIKNTPRSGWSVRFVEAGAELIWTGSGARIFSSAFKSLISRANAF